MRNKRSFVILLLLITAGCVDRVFFDIPVPSKYNVSISGFVSDQPGPYTVNVYRAFDIESTESPRTGVFAKSVVISDNLGNSETLEAVMSGVYQTSPSGMRGKVGQAYKVKVELLDGRVYESVPDTLRGGSKLDSTYYEVSKHYSGIGIEYMIDIFADATADPNLTTTYFMWGNKTTYKALTHPELEPTDPMDGGQCYRDPDDYKCNYKDPCSGLKNVGTNFAPKFDRIKPCECCVCWYDRYNDQVILNDKVASSGGGFRGVRTDRVPLTGWLLMYKMRAEVFMQSLSPQAREFWKNVRDQRTAVSNIFQPVTGKIKGNIVQTAGADEPAEGLFYATSIDTKVFYIFHDDVPENIIPTTKFKRSDWFSCLKLAPNATATEPAFWTE